MSELKRVSVWSPWLRRAHWAMAVAVLTLLGRASDGWRDLNRSLEAAQGRQVRSRALMPERYRAAAEIRKTLRRLRRDAGSTRIQRSMS